MVLVKRRKLQVAQDVLANYQRSAEQLQQLSPAGLFGNDRPFEIEVGFGKGLFLLSAAAANPEVSEKCLALTAHRLDRAGLEHVRLVLADARFVFAKCLPPACVQAVHTYFPDPWWKRRHHKRRLYDQEFVQDVERVLQPGGELHVWTDVGEYFRGIETLIAQCTRLHRLVPPEQQDPTHDMDYRTHFERKMRRVGKRICRSRYRRAAE
jgi:tRNA (guanine-N7-)-methyltransferase